MFLDEARLSVRMSHPNVVQTYEVIDDGQRLAIAMEYLDGQPLARVLNRLRGPQDAGAAARLRIVAKVLAGLDYAHELADYDGTPLAVVHRDVSPHNVFITYDGAVKLVDFGVAKNLANAHQTRPGALKGKFYVHGAGAVPRAVIRSARRHLRGRRDAVGDAGGPPLLERCLRRRDRGAPDVRPPVAAAAVGSGRARGRRGDLHPRAASAIASCRYATAAEMEADLEQVLTGARYAFERPLGKAVSTAFAPERTQRQLLVDHHIAASTQRQLYVSRASRHERRTYARRSRTRRCRAPWSMPPPPPLPRRAAPPSSPWLSPRTLRSVATGVAIAAPLAALIVLLASHGGTVSAAFGGHAARAVRPLAALDQIDLARSSLALTNEPIEDGHAGQADVAPSRTRRLSRPSWSWRRRRRACNPRSRPCGVTVAWSLSSRPPTSCRRRELRRGPHSDRAPRSPTRRRLRSRPRPIDVVNPFVVPPPVAVIGAPVR